MIDKRIPLFKIAANIFDSISLKDVEKTADDMQELGIYLPPYNHFYIQGNMKFILTMMQYVSEEDLSSVMEGVKPDKMQVMFEYVFDGTHMQVAMLRSFNGSEFIPVESKMFTGTDKDWTEWVAFTAVELLIVLLSTKNIEKETETCNKPNSRNRRERTMSKYASITTIKIGKITETARSGNGNGGPVRPHLRRGHIRSQPYGKGKSEVKRIFIQPMFINADQGWINSQKEYRVTA